MTKIPQVAPDWSVGVFTGQAATTAAEKNRRRQARIRDELKRVPAEYRRAFGLDLNDFVAVHGRFGSTEITLFRADGSTHELKTYPGEDAYRRVTTFGPHLWTQEDA